MEPATTIPSRAEQPVSRIMSTGPRNQEKHRDSTSQPKIAAQATRTASYFSVLPSDNNYSSKNAMPSKFSSWISDWITDWWGFEIACWIISAISLVAIVIVLESHKSKPVPEWPFQITINSLVSVFATISQMAMMTPVVECISQLKWLWFTRQKAPRLTDFQAFDDASRGPTGSLMLLGKIRGLHLASLGAAVTILSVAINTFTQQIVTYPLRQHPAGIATTPLVFNFTGASAGGDGSPGSPELNAALLIALSKNASTLSEISPDCNTGNCTWDLYPSLGVCANVTDVSADISKNSCNLTAFDEAFEAAGVTNPGYPCVNYTLPFYGTNEIQNPDGFVFESGNATLSNAVSLEPFGLLAGMQILVTAAGFGTSDSSLATTYLIYQPELNITNSSITSPIAYRLTLGLCVQMYATTVSNGRTHTSVISSQVLENETLEISAVGEFISRGNLTAVTVDTFKFGVTQSGITLLGVTLLNFLIGNTCYQPLYETTSRNNTAVLDEAWICASTFGNVLLNGLKSPNPLASIEEVMQNLATSATNTFRTGAGGYAHSIQFQGIAFAAQAYVEANYLWLIFPIAVIFLTFVFLLATIMTSQRLGSRVWKSSNLATLQGLHPNMQAHLGGLTLISEMNRKGEEIEVKLNKESKGELGVEYALVKLERETGKVGCERVAKA